MILNNRNYYGFAILTDKESDEDDGESHEGSRGQHHGVRISRAQTLVMQDHAGDADNLERKRRGVKLIIFSLEMQNGHFGKASSNLID